MRTFVASAALLVGVVTAPAAAQLRAVPDQPASASAARRGVDVFLINDGATDRPGITPDRLEVTTADAARIALVPVEHAPAVIPAHGFARVRYVGAGVIAVDVRASGTPGPPALHGATQPSTATAPLRAAATTAPIATIDLPPSSAPRSPIVGPEPVAPASPSAPVEAPAPLEQTRITANGPASGFLDRWIPWEPVYGALGAGQTAAKLQFSFGLRPFGGRSILSYATFAYTQTMFWAIDRRSAPFRTTTYSPELFLDVPVSANTRIAAGYRHDSNGGGEFDSVDVNRLFVRAGHSFDVGDGWQAELSPMAWIYVGRRDVAPGIARYWGYTGLKASIGQPDGVKLSIATRGNPASGKGAAEALVSYPMTQLGDLGIYLFGQAFTGYGEALTDYRVRMSRARFGISLTR